MRRLQQNLPRFLIILFLPISAIFISLSLFFRHRSIVQFELLVFIMLIYVVFTLVHHHLDKNLTLEVILDYILIAALGAIIAIGLLF